MYNLELHIEQLLHGLSLHRFNIHAEEVRRVLRPILDEVYNFGYDSGYADQTNNLQHPREEKKFRDILKEDAEDYFEKQKALENDTVVIPAGD